MRVFPFCLWCAWFCLVLASRAQEPAADPSLQEFIAGFKGKGALEDGSKPLTPEETLAHFRLAPGLVMEDVAHEPTISQPLNMYWDERGRLWVVQYLQYPNPAGLKVLKYDEYLRAVYDKVPPPPPHHFKGRDRITILEDVKGDGQFTQAHDFLSDLNLARSVVTGRGGVWLLNPPYLLFYPDRNGDDRPDGDPEVVLSGFGLEDTHSGANSLAWGPDGWLYGAHGSTCTAEVKGVKFLGQAIWRYQPEQKVFEIFAEGGGNTYSLEFDSEGRAFSGTNAGNTRGLHYPQGGAAVKTWSKHGPLMNPFSFGWYEHMGHQGYAPRFAQTLVVYEGGAIPQLAGWMVAPMSLQNRVMGSRLERDTSTYRTVDDTAPLVQTDDRWFRPVDTKVGPDGAIYLADWYDSRLTHVDPRDTWDKEHGRILRLKAAGGVSGAKVNLGAMTSVELTGLSTHANKWHRQTALRLLYDRKDATLVPMLQERLRTEIGQPALEALWALHATGGLTDDVAAAAMGHANPMVRYWAVRLVGDRFFPARYSSAAGEKPAVLDAAVAEKLRRLAVEEPEGQVRGQLAATAKRLPAQAAWPILRELIFHAEDAADKHNPLLVWWALESAYTRDAAGLRALLQDTAVWEAPLFKQHLLGRIGQRCTAGRTENDLLTAAELLRKAPTAEAREGLVAGLELGARGDKLTAVPTALQAAVGELWPKDGRPGLPVVAMALRVGYAPARTAVVGLLQEKGLKVAERKSLLELVGEQQVEEAVPVMLGQLAAATGAARLPLVEALARFAQPEIGPALLNLAPKATGTERAALLGALTRRPEWARGLLQLVADKRLAKEALSPTDLFAVQSLHDAQADALLHRVWGSLRPSSAAKLQKQAQVRTLLATGKGDAAAGQALFTARCATCHQMHGQGGAIGPDLTGYERDNLNFLIPAIVDPSLGIREEYTAYTINTKAGATLTGFITENGPAAVVIRDLAGASVRLGREEIATQAALPTSVMPEGLLEGLRDSELRDLFAFLMKK